MPLYRGNWERLNKNMKVETKLKKWTLTRWKKEAWTQCSIYNRMKDADWRGYNSCCTCGKTMMWKEGDAGHFQNGRKNAVLFYDKGIHFQCKECNGPGGGEQYKYGLYIERRYGIEEVKYQQKLKKTTKQYTKQDYIDLVDEYKEKIKNLCK